MGAGLLATPPLDTFASGELLGAPFRVSLRGRIRNVKSEVRVLNK